jgi:myo-inositol-1(or 4)-monophosphatase
MQSNWEILEKVKNLAESTGTFILKEAERFRIDDAASKGLNDFVSYVDLGSEKILVNGLNKILPEAGFIAEEGTVENTGEEYSWVIDPLDGTTNFMHGLPAYSISIALVKGDEIILGLVYSIKNNEMFYAARNKGAWLNGRQIYVSDTSRVKDMLVGTGFPFTNYKLLDPYLDTLKYFIENTHGVRRIGSAAIDLAYVACGRFDSFFEYNLNPWDVSAGILLIREAGGIVSDFSGKQEKLTGKEIVASNSVAYKEFFEAVNTRMKAG